MNNEEYEKLNLEIDRLYTEGNHKDIIKLILSYPREELSDDIIGQLAVAYNNTGEYDLAIETLILYLKKAEIIILGFIKYHMIFRKIGYNKCISKYRKSIICTRKQKRNNKQ